MRYVLPDVSTMAALSTVSLLGAVGVMAHIDVDTPDGTFDAIDGSLQVVYEQRFDDANPLQNIAVSTISALRWGLFGQGTPDLVVGRDGWLFTAEDFQNDADFEPRFNAAIDQVAHVNAVLAAQGIKLLIVALPDKAEVYHDKLGFARSERVAMRHRHFVRDVQSTGAAIVDGFAALQAGRAQQETFQRDDTHWSSFGAKMVAAQIADRIQTYDLDLSHAEVTTTYTGSQPHDGDLLQFTDTGMWRAFVGPDQSTIAQYETTVVSSGGLFGDAAVEVALVGTSYSARTEWHFVDHLQTALQSEVVSFATAGEGPFAPMSEMLNADEFKENPPKIVIWEIPTRYTTLDIQS